MTPTGSTTGGTHNIQRRAAWLVLALCVVLSAAVIPIGLTRGASISGLKPFVLADIQYPLQNIAFALAGVLVVSRRPENRIWAVLTASALAGILFGFGSEYTILALVRSPGSLPGGQVAAWLTTWLFQPIPTLLALILLIFPTGRPLSRRWRPALWLLPLYVVLGWIPPAFSEGWAQNSAAGAAGLIKNPLALASAEPWLRAMAGLSNLVLGVAFLLGVASLIVRYRRGGSDERHQLKFFLFAAALSPLGFLLYPVYSGTAAMTAPGFLAFAVVTVGVLGLPLAIGVAIVKYRLYDIDVVISRTLVFGSLAGFITGIYVAIVVGFGALIGSGGKPNLLLSIVATGMVAIAFQPVRERVQHVANRLVYGKRATPYEVLSHFSEHVAESYAAEEVLPRMAQVLASGTGAEHADVWLGNEPPLRQAASWPVHTVSGLATRSVDVRHHGELLGALSVTKRTGESLTPVEEKLLDDLAHQAGLVLKNVGLTAELRQRLEDLRASRQRLVAAQDEERRRLERNLHDGAQQNLVALKLKLGLVEMLATKDPARARTLLGEVKCDADDALETLRDLARGIYPPLLAERGLGAALESQARKATLPVTIEAANLGRHAPEIEAAIYFCCLEALQNVQKYGSAAQATVRITESDSALSFEVEDDGCGFDTASTKRGSGLQNMEDRLDALGGSLTITSVPGGGTTLAGSIPVRELAAA